MNRMILVNGTHPCPDGFGPDLVPVSSSFPELRMDREAAGAFHHLMDDLSAWDAIVPVSAWRSWREQLEIWESSLQEHGRAYTEQFVARPGCSEHQTGLAIDVGLAGENVDFICPDFPDTGITGDFARLAPDYGFVLRYPKGKEAVTGIAHEPWHFRYVGIPDARTMTSRGLTLEEYLNL